MTDEHQENQEGRPQAAAKKEEIDELRKEMRAMNLQIVELARLVARQNTGVMTKAEQVSSRLIAAGKLRDLGIGETLVRSVIIGGISVGLLGMLASFFESNALFMWGTLAMIIGPAILIAALATDALDKLQKFLAQEAA